MMAQYTLYLKGDPDRSIRGPTDRNGKSIINKIKTDTKHKNQCMKITTTKHVTWFLVLFVKNQCMKITATTKHVTWFLVLFVKNQCMKITTTTKQVTVIAAILCPVVCRSDIMNVLQKYQICCKPVSLCSSLVKSKLTWLHPKELK